MCGGFGRRVNRDRCGWAIGCNQIATQSIFEHVKIQAATSVSAFAEVEHATKALVSAYYSLAGMLRIQVWRRYGRELWHWRQLARLRGAKSSFKAESCIRSPETKDTFGLLSQIEEW